MRGAAALLSVAVLVVPPAAPAGSEPAGPLPWVVPDSVFRPLRERVDADLQEALEGRIAQEPRWSALVRDGRMAVGLVDLTLPESPLFAAVNGSTMMYAASLPKIAILLSAVKAFEDGTLNESPANIRDLQLMVRRSSNSAATRMIDLVGGLSAIEAVLTDPRYELYDPGQGGGLWVGRPYAQGGESHRDPLKGISHGASVTQVCRFYYLLATGRLISPRRSLQMLEIMSEPATQHKFVRTLGALEPRATLYRKSGTWRKWHADSVLVWGNSWRRYILAGIVEDPRGGFILENLVMAAEEVLGHPSVESVAPVD